MGKQDSELAIQLERIRGEMHRWGSGHPCGGPLPLVDQIVDFIRKLNTHLDLKKPLPSHRWSSTSRLTNGTRLFKKARPLKIRQLFHSGWGC